MVNPICVTFTEILKFPKLKRRNCWLATKSLNLIQILCLLFNPRLSSFFQFSGNQEALLSNKPVKAAHISIIKGKERLSYIMGMWVIKPKSDLVLIQLNHYILVSTDIPAYRKPCDECVKWPFSNSMCIQRGEKKHNLMQKGE